MISAAKVRKENEAHKDSEGDCTNRPSRCMNRDFNRAVVSQGAKKIIAVRGKFLSLPFKSSLIGVSDE